METNSNQITSQKKIKTPTFARFIKKKKKGVERFFGNNFDGQLDMIKQEIYARNNQSSAANKSQIFSSQHIAKQMIYNHVMILKSIVDSMSELFSEEEMLKILRINPTPIWQTNPYIRVFDMCVAHYNVRFEDDDLINQRPLIIMLKKLDELNFSENFALLDICERYWRNKREGSLVEILNKMGLILS